LKDSHNLDGLQGLGHIEAAKGTCAILDGIRDAVNQVVVVKFAVWAALEAAKLSLGWFLGNTSLKLDEPHGHVLDGEVQRIFAIENTTIEVLNPLVIFGGNTGVPSAKTSVDKVLPSKLKIT
jgi:hypothetical protein